MTNKKETEKRDKTNSKATEATESKINKEDQPVPENENNPGGNRGGEPVAEDKEQTGTAAKEENSDNIEEQAPTAEEKLAEMQDKYLRLSAEFDNYRKRTLKERIEMTKTAGESILVNILPVMDDFDRAVKIMENAPDVKAMKEGIDLIYNKLRDFLKQNGIKEIESDNREFDTDLHEAVTSIPAPEKKMKGKVVDTIQKGYYLHDKVIRFSKVVIGE
ncbi:MAG: nucleotide exchange factor GrpE [Bacteroidales bacterium]|nr:nucleotide exchange factor GrpE [Bacteroidales bacterium]